jgi:hypothetical protein
VLVATLNLTPQDCLRTVCLQALDETAVPLALLILVDAAWHVAGMLQGMARYVWLVDIYSAELIVYTEKSNQVSIISSTTQVDFTSLLSNIDDGFDFELIIISD